MKCAASCDNVPEVDIRSRQYRETSLAFEDQPSIGRYQPLLCDAHALSNWCIRQARARDRILTYIC
jgi:hypothetical protein